MNESIHIDTMTPFTMTDCYLLEFKENLLWVIADCNPTDEYSAHKEYIKEHFDENGEFADSDTALAEWQSDNDAEEMINLDTYNAKPAATIVVTELECDDEIFLGEVKVHGTDADLYAMQEFIEGQFECRIKFADGRTSETY